MTDTEVLQEEVELFDLEDHKKIGLNTLFCKLYNGSHKLQRLYNNSPMSAFESFTNNTLPTKYFAKVFKTAFKELDAGNKRPLRDLGRRDYPGYFDVFIDTETSGLGNDSRVIQLAYIVRYNFCKIAGLNKQNHSKIVYTYDNYIDWPGIKIHFAAKKIHGISTKLLQDHGLRPSTVFKTLQKVAKIAAKFIAFNAHFDKRMILNSCPEDYLKYTSKVPWLCCMKMHGTKISLAAAHIAATGSRMTDAHDALGDVRAMISVYDYIVAKQM